MNTVELLRRVLLWRRTRKPAGVEFWSTPYAHRHIFVRRVL